VCIVNFNEPVNTIKIFGVSEKCVMAEMLPETMKFSYVFTSLALFCPVLTKFRVTRQIFIQRLGVEFNGNPSRESRTESCEQLRDRWTDGYDETSRCFLGLFERT
jgi:hypothetical protein